MSERGLDPSCIRNQGKTKGMARKKAHLIHVVLPQRQFKESPCLTPISAVDSTGPLLYYATGEFVAEMVTPWMPFGMVARAGSHTGGAKEERFLHHD